MEEGESRGQGLIVHLSRYRLLRVQKLLLLHPASRANPTKVCPSRCVRAMQWAATPGRFCEATAFLQIVGVTELRESGCGLKMQNFPSESEAGSYLRLIDFCITQLEA